MLRTLRHRRTWCDAATAGRVSGWAAHVVHRSGSRSSSCLTLAGLALVAPASGAATSKADAALQRALDAFVKRSDGPNGISVVVQSGAEPVQFTAGVGDVATKAPWAVADEMRMASVAKAFSGAAAVSAVADGKLTLDSTVGEILPSQPAAWAKVTLAQLLQHTSGIPDFSKNPAFGEAVGASLTDAAAARPAPQLRRRRAADFPSGTKYKYSNTDNILVGLMVAAVDGTPYEQSLDDPRVPAALAHRHQPAGRGSSCRRRSPTATQPDPPNADEDVSEVLAAGMVVGLGRRGLHAAGRQPVRPRLRVGAADRRGHAEAAVHVPARQVGADRPGHELGRPRRSSATRRRAARSTATPATRSGYTQFIASTKDGKHSAVVSINSQITPERNPKIFPALRKIYGLAVCAAQTGLVRRRATWKTARRPVLYLEMTEPHPRSTRETACPRCARCLASSARRGGATCTATVPTCRASCPSSTPSACTSARRRSSRPPRPTASPVTTSCARPARARVGSPASPRCRCRWCSSARRRPPRRRRCATGVTSCTSTTSSRPASPASP